MRAVRRSVPFPVPSPRPPVLRGYALPGQGDRSPPKQVVVRGLGHIESAPAVFGYFPPVESTAPQAPTEKTKA